MNKHVLIFVEIYKKNSQKVEDKQRINSLFNKPVKICDELYDGENEFLNSD